MLIFKKELHNPTKPNDWNLGHLGVVEYLIRKGANTEARDYTGGTILSDIIQFGN